MGDFFQMPPVGGRMLTDAGLDKLSPAASALFKSFVVCQLTQQMRASGDVQWIGVLDAFTDPVKSMTPVLQSNVLGIVREFSVADVASDDKWRDAIVVTYDNATRHAINKAQAVRYARRNGLPVIAWPQRLDDKSSAAFDAAAQRHACSVGDVRAPYDAELTFYFVAGAPAFLTANISVEKGLVNSARVRLHSLTLNASVGVDAAWQRIARAHAGQIVHLDEPPLALNVEVRVLCTCVMLTYAQFLCDDATAARWLPDETLLAGKVVIPLLERKDTQLLKSMSLARARVAAGSLDEGASRSKQGMQYHTHGVELGFGITVMKVSMRRIRA